MLSRQYVTHRKNWIIEESFSVHLYFVVVWKCERKTQNVGHWVTMRKIQRNTCWPICLLFSSLLPFLWVNWMKQALDGCRQKSTSLEANKTNNWKGFFFQRLSFVEVAGLFAWAHGWKAGGNSKEKRLH